MKTLIFFLFTLVVSATAACAQTTAADILKDYKQKSATALERLNKTLETQGASIAASLVGQGDAAGADELSKQIKAKIDGEAVLKPHSAAITLFRQYDAARTNALKPVQAASISKIEALLKTSAGKKMETVLELGKARQEIESGKAAISSDSAELPEVWTWHLRSEIGPSGTIMFKKDGTIEQQIVGRANPSFGKWKKTKTANLYTLTLENETFSMLVEGSAATLDMSFGKRYLKVKQATE